MKKNKNSEKSKLTSRYFAPDPKFLRKCLSNQKRDALTNGCIQLLSQVCLVTVPKHHSYRVLFVYRSNCFLCCPTIVSFQTSNYNLKPFRSKSID